MAKMSNYVAQGKSRFAGRFQTIADGFFTLFALCWIPTRHVVLPFLYYYMWTEAESSFFAFGCDCGQGRDCVWAPERGCVLDKQTMPQLINIYRVLLGLFQCMLAAWLVDLLKAVHKALTSDGPLSTKGLEESSMQNCPELDDSNNTASKKQD